MQYLTHIKYISGCKQVELGHVRINQGKNIKKPPKLPNCIKDATYFLFSYNTLILLTNKIIVKK